jgi:quercetin dioxygenase-like cupin family protein
MVGMTPPAAELAVFLADLAGLVEGAATGEAVADCRRFGVLTRALQPTDMVASGARPFSLPVCRCWAPALAAAREQPGLAAIAHSLQVLGPYLAWTQNPNYRQSPPSAGFLNDYGYAVVAGPAGGPRSLVTHPSLALGVLLLAPRTHYPRHHHPATELYLPLNPAQWWRGEGPWRDEAPGAVIHHAPNVAHATQAGDEPLLAIYLWTGDLATHARIEATA